MATKRRAQPLSVKVTRGFAVEVKSALTEEREDGSSLLTDLLDAASQKAHEDGSEWWGRQGAVTVTPEVIIPRRITLDRMLVAIVIAIIGAYTFRAYQALAALDRAAEIQRGPGCTSTTYYDECQYQGWLVDGDGFRWRCGR